MDALDIIRKKRDGFRLTAEELDFFVQQYNAGEIPDYQAAAFCMAIYLKGMNKHETINLTMSLVNSGEHLDLSDVIDFALDKHSSGGVGDKTTLVVLPLAAACGLPVAKMSGRGLSFTGGTLDKLESISGFNTNLTRQQFIEQVVKEGIVLSGQTADLAPADGKFYALRDVTGTVSSLPLIASSIMSKKIAAGAQGLVLDVKCGLGAFMSTVEKAKALARIMVDIGTGVNIRTTALISDMNQPLGQAVGNAIEVREAINTLRGHGPADLIEHAIVITGHMLKLAGKSAREDLSDIRPVIMEKLANGEAYEKFLRMVAAQGGDVSQVENPENLPAAPVIKTCRANQTGYVSLIHAKEVGLTALELGAGRKRKEDPVDHAVGVEILKTIGERVEKDTPLFTIHARSEELAEMAAKRLYDAHLIQEEPTEALPLFYDIIFGKDTL